MTILVFFIFGLIIGSFLNVVIYRLQIEENILGRSYCRGCKEQIAWYDNVPVLSFAVLRGRCRNCREKISWQYPLVELGTGVLFALVGAYFFTLSDVTGFVPTVFYLILFSLLLVIFVYDLLTMYIPMLPVWIALACTAVYIGVSHWLFVVRHMVGAVDPDMLGHALSGAGAFAFFYALVRVSRETWMGMGDAYLALLVGTVLGWPWVLWGMTMSFGIGAAAGLLLIAFGKKGMKSQIPFAPFLVLGVWLTILLPKIFPVLGYFMLLE